MRQALSYATEPIHPAHTLTNTKRKNESDIWLAENLKQTRRNNWLAESNKQVQKPFSPFQTSKQTQGATLPTETQTDRETSPSYRAIWPADSQIHRDKWPSARSKQLQNNIQSSELGKQTNTVVVPIDEWKRHYGK